MSSKKGFPVKIKELIDYAISYIGVETNDWFKIKGELANLFPPSERGRFSRRHHSTKKHILNLFDKQVINYWESQTGINLWIDPEKLHPKNWEQKPRGWGLREFNEKRRKEKEAAAKATAKNSS